MAKTKMNLKVKVIASQFSHIKPGMIGEIEPDNIHTFQCAQPEDGVPVLFRKVPSTMPIPHDYKPKDTTVMMQRKELEHATD